MYLKKTGTFLWTWLFSAYSSIALANLVLLPALEFAYTEAPHVMQGMLMGINHLTTGLGALLGSAIYNIVAVVTESNGICFYWQDLFSPLIADIHSMKFQVGFIQWHSQNFEKPEFRELDLFSGVARISR